MNPDVSPTAAVSCLIKTCQNGNCVNDSCQCTPNYAGDYCQKAYSLSGCYWNDLPVELIIPLITPQICVDACIKGSYEYAGLRIGYRCKCGTNISDPFQAAMSACDVDCNGDSAYKCGGAQAMSIYHIV
ncbi:xylosyltransferase oxt-like [Mytilus edulis]|uniref:xylosyltransferase oxt-like n=1 Tax=Mytilus edulis TaxID=6550 RepID=UPI0039EFE0D0